MQDSHDRPTQEKNDMQGPDKNEESSEQLQRDMGAGSRVNPQVGAQANENEHSSANKNLKADQTAQTAKRKKISRGDIVKFSVLIGLVVASLLAVAVLWTQLAPIFGEGGIDLVVEKLRDAGSVGVIILLALQLLQIVVAVIPGEVTQVAAGMLYGPLWGSVVVIVGAAMASSIVYALVHRLGAPFVQHMVSGKFSDKFQKFEQSGKLNAIVFILFLIPAMPKDVFTYLVPLTDMRYRSFILITTVARIPGVLVSTFAASNLVDGNFTVGIIIFVVAAIIVAIAAFFRDKIYGLLDRK